MICECVRVHFHVFVRLRVRVHVRLRTIRAGERVCASAYACALK
jgi:hypothetical protein